MNSAQDRTDSSAIAPAPAKPARYPSAIGRRWSLQTTLEGLAAVARPAATAPPSASRSPCRRAVLPPDVETGYLATLAGRLENSVDRQTAAARSSTRPALRLDGTRPTAEDRFRNGRPAVWRRAPGHGETR